MNKKISHKLIAVVMTLVVLSGIFDWNIIKSVITYAQYEEYAAEYNVYFNWMDEDNRESTGDTTIIRDILSDPNAISEGYDHVSTAYPSEDYSNAEYKNKVESIFAEFTIDSPNVLEAGECTFTISGLYELKRGGGLILVMDDEALSNDWIIDYDEENDVYTFTNQQRLNKDYSTTFHWYVNACDCVDGYKNELVTSCTVTHKAYTTVETQCYALPDGTFLVDPETKAPLELTEDEARKMGAEDPETGDLIKLDYTYSEKKVIEGVPLSTNNLDIEFYSRPDEFDVTLTGDVLKADEYEQLSNEYTWFEYTTVIDRHEYARGLEGSSYDITIQLPDDFVAGIPSEEVKDYLQILDKNDAIINDDVEVSVKDGKTYLKFRQFEKYGGFENKASFKIGLNEDRLKSISDLNKEENRLHVYGYFDGQLYDQRENENPDKYVEASETIYYSGDTAPSGSGRTPTPYNYGDHSYERYESPEMTKTSDYENQANHSRPEVSKRILANSLFGTSGRNISFTLKPVVRGEYEASDPIGVDGSSLTKGAAAGAALDEEEKVILFAAGDSSGDSDTNEKSDFEYELIVGDDAIAIYREDKTARVLTDDEYNYTRISIPRLLDKKTSTDGEYGGYNYDIYIKRTSEGAYEKFTSGNTSDSSDIILSGAVKAVCVRVHGVKTSIYDFKIKVDVNVKLDNEKNLANIDAENGYAIDTENRLVNYGYIQMLKPESGGGFTDYAALKNTSSQLHTAGDGETSADSAVYTRNGQYELDNAGLLNRVYANAWLRNAMTTVASETSMSAFKYIPKGAPDPDTGELQVVPIHKTTITSTGTIISESPGALYNFRMYAVIPDNLKLTDETLETIKENLELSAVQQASGEPVNKSYLLSSPYVYTLKQTTLNGQSVIEADFHFKAALKMDSETKVTLKYDAYITGEDLSKLGTSERLFTASTYMMVLDSGVEVKNADDKPALVNLAVDGNQKAAALSTDNERINLADKQRSVQSSKYVTTYMHPNGSITSRVEGKNINETNSYYQYHLSFTDYINVSVATPLIHDPILLDIVEYTPLSKAERNEGKTVNDEGLWQGTLMGVDVSSVVSQGFEPVVYYKQVPKKDGDNQSAEMSKIKDLIDNFEDTSYSDDEQIKRYDDFAEELKNPGSDWRKMTTSGNNIFVPSETTLQEGYVYVVAIVLAVPSSDANKEHEETIGGESKTYLYMPVTSTDHTITMDVALNMQAPPINNGTADMLTSEEAKQFVNNNQYARNDFSSVVVDSTIHANGEFSTSRYSYIDSNPTEVYLSHLVRFVKVEENDTTRRLEGAKFSVYYDEARQIPVWWWVNENGTPTIDRMVQISDVRGYVEFSLAPGEYYVKEELSPKGYLRDDTVYKIIVPENDDEVQLYKPNASGTYENITASVYDAQEEGLFIENKRIENVKVRFVKKDADSDELISLNGAKYSVYKVEDTISDTPVSFVYQRSMKKGLQGCYVYSTSTEPYDQNEAGDNYSNTLTNVLESGVNNKAGEVVKGKISSDATVNVGKDGSIWLANLPDGLYVIREVSAPEGYDISSSDFYFRVVPSRTTTPSFTSTEPNVQSDVYNKIGWIMFSDNDTPATSESEEGEEGESGEETSETSTLTGETEKALYDTQKKSVLRIKKTAYSETTPFGGAALSGARYTLLKLKSEYENDVATALQALVDVKGDYKAAKDGTNLYWSAVTTRAKTGSNGIATVENLAFGYYVFIENTAPKGYTTNVSLFGAKNIGSGVSYIVNPYTDTECTKENLKDSGNIIYAKHVDYDEKTDTNTYYSLYCYKIDGATAEKYYDKEPYTFYQEDEKKTGQARVEKTDAATGLELNKAYYQLYKQVLSEGVDPVTATKGKTNAELKAYYATIDGADGASTNPVPVSDVLATHDQGYTDNVTGLEWGDNVWYYFVEVRAPLGYKRNAFVESGETVPVRRYFNVTSDNADILIKVYDTDKRENGKIDLHKHAINDDVDAKSMEGAKFQLVTKDESKTVMNFMRTDANGKYNASGNYWYVCTDTVMEDDVVKYLDAEGTKKTAADITNEAEILNSGNHLNIINIPWGVYSLVETQVPAGGYGVADDITVVVNDKNAATKQELDCEEPDATAEIEIEKLIPTVSADVFEEFGYPTFTFKISECDSSGNLVDGGLSYVTSIGFNESSEVESSKFTGSKKINVKADKYYLIEEVTVSRYGIDDVEAKHSEYSEEGGERICNMTANAGMVIGGEKVLCDMRMDGAHLSDIPKVSAKFDNSIKRYDMLSHTSSVNNSFTAPPQVTGFTVDYEKTIPVDRINLKNTLTYADIEALLMYNTTTEGEDKIVLTDTQKAGLTFGVSSDGGTTYKTDGGFEITEGDGGIVVDYSGADINDVFGSIDTIKVSYTDENGKTYTADMAIFFNTRSPDVKKDVIFHAEATKAGDTPAYYFPSSKVGKRYSNSFTFYVSSDGEVSIEPLADSTEGDYGFNLNTSEGPSFYYWELLTGDPAQAGVTAVTDNDGKPIMFRGTKAEIIQQIKDYFSDGTLPGGATIDYDALNMNNPLDTDPEKREFHFRAVPVSTPAKLANTATLRAAFNELAGNAANEGSLTNITAIKKGSADAAEGLGKTVGNGVIGDNGGIINITDPDRTYYQNDVYAYYDDDKDILYWYTLDYSAPLLAGNRNGLFSNFTKLTDISGITTPPETANDAEGEGLWMTYDKNYPNKKDYEQYTSIDSTVDAAVGYYSLTNTALMFNYTYVKDFNMSSWNMHNVREFGGMFRVNLPNKNDIFNLDLHGWDVTNMINDKTNGYTVKYENGNNVKDGGTVYGSIEQGNGRFIFRNIIGQNIGNNKQREKLGQINISKWVGVPYPNATNNPKWNYNKTRQDICLVDFGQLTISGSIDMTGSETDSTKSWHIKKITTSTINNNNEYDVEEGMVYVYGIPSSFAVDNNSYPYGKVIKKTGS